jgi:cellulose synthase/poly-beta-1,6-N-acetylglucosamine synthase-like glycosyltransferase
MSLVILLGLITLAVVVFQTISFRRLCAHVESELSFVPAGPNPQVAVILPCKGLDPGFEDNVVRLMQQDYQADGKPAFEVIFAVAEADDPAYPVLAGIAEESRNVRATLVVAGKSEKRSQKINNQLAALEKVSDDASVLVFVDSDVIARPDFLTYLVARLEQSDVGATTGYRFYVPYKGDGASLIRSLWNRMSAWELANPSYSFAWGGTWP